MRVIATDLLERRLGLARKFGAKWGVEVQSPESKVQSPKSKVGHGHTKSEVRGSLEDLVCEVTDRRGLDAAVIAVPSDAVVQQAQSLLRGGGQVLLFSHTRRGQQTALDLATVCVDEKDLIGSYSADYLLQKKVARLVFSRELDVSTLITHRFPLDKTAAAVELASHPTPESLKVVVQQSPDLDGDSGGR
jgi:L-iditol 2-dehydrogenase